MARTRAPRLPGLILKGLLTLLILSVNAILIWRMCTSGDPAAIRTLSVNDKTRAAYQAHGDALVLQYQEQASITRSPESYGYFSVTQCIFIPEANQVQIVVRYNNSTLTHLKEDYKLPAIPDRAGDYFDVTLVRTTDLTPNDTSDNLEETNLRTERYFPNAEVRTDSTALYNYRRFVFDGVTVEDLTVGIFVDIYYNEDVNYDERAYGTLCLYDREMTWLPYTLTRADREALTAPVGAQP